MGKDFQGKIEQIDDNRWRIPKSIRPDMRVDGIIYSSGALIGEDLGLTSGDQISITLDGIEGEIPARIVNVSRNGTHLQFPAEPEIRQRVTHFLQTHGHLEEAA